MSEGPPKQNKNGTSDFSSEELMDLRLDLAQMKKAGIFSDYFTTVLDHSSLALLHFQKLKEKHK